MKKFISAYPVFKLPLLAAGLMLLLFSCKSGQKSDDDGDTSQVEAQTPVTVTTVGQGSMTDYIDLNATSVFLQKNYVKSNTNGYVEKVYVQPGHFVNKGELLFTIKTKEAEVIGNSINVLDTTLKFSGINKIKAPGPGYISQLNHQAGDYVQDGEALATISDRSSFVFLMQLPYELRQYVKQNETIQLTLPGGQKLDGRVASFMPSVDTVAQTQGVVIRVNANEQIPENLVAKARIVKSEQSNATSLPKEAILSNETQTEFWVMKLINPTTAIKVPITKGIESGDSVEILSPKFSPQDKIVVTGNYGLPDTAKVKIVNQ
ncbi:MAG TPA: HlyD family efflux transporter periplasmic adaptor subunit [Mucilaginibacter sp.]|nr:HlyD family efflux transporter periplasmic adaptor subunit [Mucilaginibacter sp.]